MPSQVINGMIAGQALSVRFEIPDSRFEIGDGGSPQTAEKYFWSILLIVGSAALFHSLPGPNEEKSKG